MVEKINNVISKKSFAKAKDRKGFVIDEGEITLETPQSKSPIFAEERV